MKAKYSYILLSIFVLLDLCFLFSINFPAVEINPYLLRDMERSLKVIAGHFIAVGPDFTSGSYTPGPFYYFLIAPVLIFFKTPFALVAYALIVKVIAQLVFSVKLSRTLRVPSPILYLFMSSSAFLLERFIWINNSAFIAPLVQILAVLTLWYWEAKDGRISWRILLLIALLTGGALQTHFSIFLVIPSLVILILEKKNAPRKMALWTLAGGLFLTLVPFLVVFLNDHYFHAFSGPIFFRNELGARDFAIDWGRVFIKDWKVFHTFNIFNIEVLAIFFYLISKSLWILKTRWQSKKNLSLIEKIFLTNGFLTLAFSGWFLSGSYMRYFSVLLVFALSFLVSDIYRLLHARVRWNWAPLTICLIFCLFIRYEFSKFPKALGLEGKCEACIHQMDLICKYFNSQDISYEQFSKSTYELFPANSHGSLAYLHYCFDRKTGVDLKSLKRYLFVDSDFLRHPLDLPQVLAKIPLEVRDLYQQRQNLKEEVRDGGFTLFSIKTERSLNPHEHLTNLTYAYETDPADGQAIIIGGLKANASRVYRARFCDSPVFCDLYISVNITEGRFDIKINSRAFQTKTELLPIYGRFRNLELIYLCDGRTERINLVSSLGLVQENEQNETFFTPIQVSKAINCSSWSLVKIHAESFELSMNGSKNKLWNNTSLELELL